MLSKPAMVEADVLKAKLAAGVWQQCGPRERSQPPQPPPPTHKKQSATH